MPNFMERYHYVSMPFFFFFSFFKIFEFYFFVVINMPGTLWEWKFQTLLPWRASIFYTRHSCTAQDDLNNNSFHTSFESMKVIFVPIYVAWRVISLYVVLFFSCIIISSAFGGFNKTFVYPRISCYVWSFLEQINESIHWLPSSAKFWKALSALGGLSPAVSCSQLSLPQITRCLWDFL